MLEVWLEVQNDANYCSLARAELRLALAAVIRRFDHQELFETTRMDVDVKHDLFLPHADLNSKGVRVIFK